MPPPSNTVVYSQNAKFLSTQLQSFHQMMKLWDKYNTTLQEYVSEYYNARQQLELTQSHEYYLPDIIFSPNTTLIQNTHPITSPHLLSSQKKTLVTQTYQINEIYTIQQTTLKIDHCLQMLFRVISTLQFIFHELEQQHLQQVTMSMNLLLGDPPDLTDIYNQADILTDRQQTFLHNYKDAFAKIKSAPKIANPDTRQTDSASNDDGDDGDGDDELPTRMLDLTQSHDFINENDVFLSMFDFIDPNDPPSMTLISISDKVEQNCQTEPTIHQHASTMLATASVHAEATNFMNLPFISHKMYMKWAEDVSKSDKFDADVRISTQNATTASIYKSSYQLQQELAQFGQLGQNSTDSSTTTTTHFSNIFTSRNNCVITVKPTYDCEPDSDINQSDENEDDLTTSITNQSITPKYDLIKCTIAFDSTPDPFDLSEVDNPATQSPQQIPLRQLLQWDMSTSYQVSHIYTSLLNQFSTLLDQFCTEYENKRMIVNFITATNFADIQLDLKIFNQIQHYSSQLSSNTNSQQPHQPPQCSSTHQIQITYPFPLSNRSPQSSTMTTTTTAPTQLPPLPLIYSPLHPSSQLYQSLYRSTFQTNLTHPIATYRSTSLSPLIPHSTMAQYMFILDNEPFISNAHRQTCVQQWDNMIKTHLSLE